MEENIVLTPSEASNSPAMPESLASPSEEPTSVDGAPLAAGDVITVSLLGNDLNLRKVGDHLYCPDEWFDEVVSHPCLPLAAEFISRLSPVALMTPWTITSATKDLSGAIRSDSPSHSEGRALDISPLYSEDTLLSADMPMMGLAWNIKSLIVLSEGQWGDIPVFVEGDHLHIGMDIKPDKKGCLPIMWSDSNAYPSQEAQSLDPILPKLRNSFWRWCTTSLSLEPPSAALESEIRSMLKNE